MTFDESFETLTGHPPFPWQRALYDRFLSGDLPGSCDLPTGLGKTSVIAVWLLALSNGAKTPRRLVYVVNRRTVVDQATAEAERYRLALATAPSLKTQCATLRSLGSVQATDAVAISTLRGQFADNAQWRIDPSRPAIVIGTVDMVGSRLLFSGYGCGFKTKPLHAGFLGQDSLLVHDEAHLEPAFQSLITEIASAQVSDPLRLKVMALTATSRGGSDAFVLSRADHEHPVVKQRLRAAKGISFHEVADKSLVHERVSELALQHRESNSAVLVFLRTVEDVERCAKVLRGAVGKDAVEVLTGTMRGRERDELTRSSPVFARFMPKPTSDVSPMTGSVFLVSTSAGEVGIDISADHMVSDLSPFDSLAQRLGRLNRYGKGDALVDIVCDPLAPPEPDETEDEEADPEEAAPIAGRELYEAARYQTLILLRQLPARPDGRLDGSPAALRALPAHARELAFTPAPEVPSVDEFLFDRWALTSIVKPMPGRPPVEDWLHGVAEWEPPRTTVAWRDEVEWLSEADLGGDTLADFLADYPLRPHEQLSDRSDRITKQLKKAAAREGVGTTFVWVQPPGEEVSRRLLNELLNEKDSLNGALLILPPSLGLLANGLFDGSASRHADEEYDLGCWSPAALQRQVCMGEEPLEAESFRLVRAIARQNGEGDDSDAPEGRPRVWELFTRPAEAADEGSRTSRRAQRLDEHLTATESWAKRIVSSLAIGAEEQSAVIAAARWHDLGKDRGVWQRAIRNREYPRVVLAKGRVRPLELGHYRHELGSLLDAEKDASFAAMPEPVRDLLLHLIAAHHGRARPVFPPHEEQDPQSPDAEVLRISAETPLRFERLQKKYGRWGLAYLESLVRAADYLASDEEFAS